MRMEHDGPAITQDDRVDRAWSILLGAALCMTCGQAAVLLFTFGVFSPEIVSATGWSPVAIATAMIPGTILAALLAPVAGLFIDRFGVRTLVLLGGPLYALGFVLMGLLSDSPGAFIVLMALTCGLGFAATPVAYAQLITGWFARRRGLALGLMFAGASLGVATWAPYAAWLIRQFGWRTAYVSIGLTAGSIIFLSAVFLLRNPPKPASVVSQTAVSGMTFKEALRTSTFWRLAAIFMLLTGALGGASVNMPVILRQQGIEPGSAASIMAVVGVGMLLGRVLAGVLLDRWFAPYITVLSSSLPLLAFALLLVDHSTVSLVVAAGMLGFGLGAELDAAAYIVSRAFGVRAFGRIYGIIFLIYGLSSAAGPGIVGAALAQAVSIDTIFMVIIALLIAAIALLLTLKRSDLPFAAHGR